MIVEDTALLEGVVGSQVAGPKYKEVIFRDEKIYWPSKKAKGKYYGSNAVKMGGANPCKRYVCIEQDYLVHYSR